MRCRVRVAGVPLLTAAGILLLFPGGRLEAREPPVEPTAEGVANYPYTQDLGVGGYSAGQQDVFNVKLPVRKLFRSPEEHAWGLRLRFPISFGVYGLKLDDFFEDPDFDLDSVRSFTVVPAAEFLIPLSERWMLKPRQDFGIGRDLETQEWIWITSTEVQGTYTRPWKNLVFTFGSGVKYSFSNSASDLFDDDFALLKLGFDTLIPVGIDVGKRRVDASLFVVARHYFRELVFDQVLADPIVIEQEYEVGLTIGSTPLPRIWKFNVPRFLIGYRFSEDLRGLRIKFGLPF